MVSVNEPNGREGMRKQGTTTTRSNPRNHRTSQQRELHRAEVAKLTRKGYSLQMIAEELKVSYATVKQDWKAILTEYRENRDEDTEALVQAKLQEYAEVKREAWKAWERSKLGTVEEEERESLSNKGGSRRTLSRIKKSSAGDSTFLIVIADCLKAERELLSLNPTKKVEVKGNMTWDVLSQAIPDGEVPDEIENAIRLALEGDGIIKAPHGQLPNQEADTIILDRKNGTQEETSTFNPQTLDELEEMTGEET